MARCGEAFRNRVVARLLPPESAEVGEVSREMGVTAPTLERWREEAQSRPARGRVWTARGRLEAVITTAAMDKAGKGAWCREHGVYLRARKQNPALVGQHPQLVPDRLRYPQSGTGLRHPELKSKLVYDPGGTAGG
jgi:hypothetical protein